MHHEETRAVAAPAEVVWRIMADVEHWPAWTRSISSVELDGPLAVGATARIKQPRFPVATWTVTELDPGRSFIWESRVTGLVSVGEHRVADAPAGTSVVTLRIEQTGPLSGLMGLLFGGVTRRYVGMEADGLQQEATR